MIDQGMNSLLKKHGVGSFVFVSPVQNYGHKHEKQTHSVDFKLLSKCQMNNLFVGAFASQCTLWYPADYIKYSLIADSWLHWCTVCVSIPPPWIHCVHQWNTDFCNALLAPVLILMWVKIGVLVRTLLCRHACVFVAKIMDNTGNKRKWPFGNDIPLIKTVAANVRWTYLHDGCMHSWDLSIYFMLILALFGILKQWVSKPLHASKSCWLFKPKQPDTHLLAATSLQTLFPVSKCRLL